MVDGSRAVGYTTAVSAQAAAQVSDAEFAAKVDSVLQDARGWKQHGYLFVRNYGGNIPTVNIRLETGAAADRICNGSGGFSCQFADTVVVHLGNWLKTSPTNSSQLPVDRYQTYVVNHEVGHYLGLDHAKCPAGACAKLGLAACPASVMQQMTRGPGHVAPCAENEWPWPPGHGVDEPRRRPWLLIVLVLLVLVLCALAGARICSSFLVNVASRGTR